MKIRGTPPRLPYGKLPSTSSTESSVSGEFGHNSSSSKGDSSSAKMEESPGTQKRDRQRAGVYSDDERGPMIPRQHSDWDVESGRESVSFATVESRNRFIAVVYMILALMLLIWLAVNCMFVFIQPLKQFAQDYSLLTWVVFIIWAVMLCAMASPPARHFYPFNIILLMVFAVVSGVMTGMISALADEYGFILALLGTLIVVVVVSILAIVSPVRRGTLSPPHHPYSLVTAVLPPLCRQVDITAYGFIICVVTLCLCLVSLVVLPFYIFVMDHNTRRLTRMTLPPPPPNHMAPSERFLHFSFHSIFSIVIACAFIVVLSISLIYRTQLIVGGRQYEIHESEYALGAVMLFTDIINLYLYMLQLISATRG
ncbi:unnamed protein product [Cyprideis torosa]|uniref:Uncharacterized protein n=1 Tax=Cyprideis torosa TaxID=163714 RepID=A0A7R8W905_9CRUS|nr:unnamed protein product [Cyprideis torosa]CAG0889234.1 unnamed protein product [Cyprideis torosa]